MHEYASAIRTQHEDAVAVITAVSEHIETLMRIATILANTLRRGGTLFLCGNGGSAADAQHVAAEFVGRFLRERRPLPAMALTANTSTLTAIANDYEYAEVFARQVVAYATPVDCVIGISTSGRSTNVIKALAAARSIGASTVGFTGATGGAFAAICDECFCAPSEHTPRIQEAHVLAWHLVCDVVEQAVMSSDTSEE